MLRPKNDSQHPNYWKGESKNEFYKKPVIKKVTNFKQRNKVAVPISLQTTPQHSFHEATLNNDFWIRPCNRKHHSLFHDENFILAEATNVLNIRIPFTNSLENTSIETPISMTFAPAKKREINCIRCQSNCLIPIFLHMLCIF